MTHSRTLLVARRGAIAILCAFTLLAALAPGASWAAEWGARQLQEIGLETPTPLQPGPDILSSMPEETRKKVKSYAMQMAQDGEEFVVVVARIEYKEGTPNLQGATDGAMTQAAKAMGDKDPKYNVTNMKVSGLEGRRATYQTTNDGKKLQMEAVLALRGQVIFQIQVISSGDRAADLERVLKSVKIASKAASK